MSRMLLISLTTMFFIITNSQESFANQLAAKKDGVKVTATPQANGELVATLAAGEAVDQVSRKGMFWQVKTADGKTGFVAVTLMQRQANDSATLAKAIRRAAADAREEGDDVTGNRMRTAVMGVRGLDEDEDTASAGNVRPNMDLVYKMEDRWVQAKRVRSLENRLQAEIQQRMKLLYGH
ncbi:MAG: SH3 domain-containing protein [Oligoflexus sp.]